MNRDSNIYPLLFEPNLHSVVWGGDRLCPYKGLEGGECRRVEPVHCKKWSLCRKGLDISD